MSDLRRRLTPTGAKADHRLVLEDVNLQARARQDRRRHQPVVAGAHDNHIAHAQ